MFLLNLFLDRLCAGLITSLTQFLGLAVVIVGLRRGLSHLRRLDQHLGLLDRLLRLTEVNRRLDLSHTVLARLSRHGSIHRFNRHGSMEVLQHLIGSCLIRHHNLRRGDVADLRRLNALPLGLVLDAIRILGIAHRLELCPFDTLSGFRQRIT